MTIYHPTYISGKWQVVSTSNGIDDRRNVGPRWETAKQAAAYVDRLESMEVVSPLRDPVPSSEPNELVVLGGMTDGSSAQNGEPDPHVDAVDPSPPTPSAAGFWDTPRPGSGG